MRDLIWWMSLVTTEEQGRFAEVEKVKNLVRYDRLGSSLEVKMGNTLEILGVPESSRVQACQVRHDVHRADSKRFCRIFI
jgi:hypothetical protein